MERNRAEGDLPPTELLDFTNRILGDFPEAPEIVLHHDHNGIGNRIRWYWITELPTYKIPADNIDPVIQQLGGVLMAASTYVFIATIIAANREDGLL